MKKPTIIVTGTGGFIMSNLIRIAIHNKFPANFISIDKVKKNQAINNVYTNKNHKFYIADITDQHIINTIFEIEKPDIVIHGAAETHVDDSIQDSSPFIQSNIAGTQNLLNAATRHNSKFILISTDEVYGQLNESDPPWTELSPISPRNPYSASKASSELLTIAAHHTHGLNYNITRTCNNYGPRQATDKFIPKIIQSIVNNTKMPIYGQGTQIRDWLHVADNCNAILKVVEQGKNTEIYNISANQEFSNVEVFQAIANYFGKGHDLLEFVQDRPGHDFRYSIDSSKIKTLGWEPSIKFKDGVKNTVDWYMSNQWWFRR